MSKKFFCICEDNCKTETMSKEQILTAIAQAVSTGVIGDIDTGFVTTIRERNSGAPLTFWVGTMAQYNKAFAEEPPEGCLCIIKDEATAADLARWVEENFEKKGEATAGKSFDSGMVNVNQYAAPKKASYYIVNAIATEAAGSAAASCCPVYIDHTLLSTTQRLVYGAAATDLFAVTAYLDADGLAHFEVTETAGRIDGTKQSLVIERVCGY